MTLHWIRQRRITRPYRRLRKDLKRLVPKRTYTAGIDQDDLLLLMFGPEGPGQVKVAKKVQRALRRAK